MAKKGRHTKRGITEGQLCFLLPSEPAMTRRMEKPDPAIQEEDGQLPPQRLPTLLCQKD